MTDEHPAGTGPSKKGRPTPSRKQAEAQRRAQMKQPLTRKERAKREAARRTEQRAKQKEALSTGRGKDLPYRDQGPVRAFARDYVDRRWNVAEFLLPILVITLIFSFFRTPTTAFVMLFIYAITFFAVVLDIYLLQHGLKKELVRRFGHENIGGDRPYAIMRASQMRFLRLPKPVLKRGEPLPDRYV